MHPVASPVGARQAVETDLKGRSTGRLDTLRGATLGTAAAGPVTPAGLLGGATDASNFSGEKLLSVDAMALTAVTRVRSHDRQPFITRVHRRPEMKTW